MHKLATKISEKTLEEYAILDAQIKVLNDQKDKLREDIIKDMQNAEETSVASSYGKFTIATVKTWTYSPKVTELEEKFKAQKATEQSTGEATFEEKPSLRFTQTKF